MDGTGGYYHKRNHSYTKRQILHALFYKWELNIVYTWTWSMNDRHGDSEEWEVGGSR